MTKRKLLIPAILSVIGTSAFLITKKRKEIKQDHIRQMLSSILIEKFDKDQIKGYWINFDNNDGLEYACGVNVENESGGIDSYTFIFNPEDYNIYGFKIINSSFK